MRRRPGGLTVRTAAEISVMRRAGRVVAEMHDVLRSAVRPGVTTAHLDTLAREVLARRGATSNFLGYHGFPAVICASVNDEVIHGIPGPRPLLEGDVLSVDCGAVIDGWHGDAAFTMGVGAISAAAQRLIDATNEALASAIVAMRAGNTLGDVGHAIETVARLRGVGIVEGYCGHGIGRAMHEDPDVLNTGRPGKGKRLDVGVVLAIEPMFTASGTEDTVTLDDDWTVVTDDGSLACHTEHTVAVTEHGPVVLTSL